MLTIIPVFNRELVEFVLNFLLTNISHIIMHIIPTIIPIIIYDMCASSKLSGIKSKHTIDIISPDANDNIKLRNFCDGCFTVIPISPPSVVPNVPKNKPINVVFINSFKKNTPSYY